MVIKTLIITLTLVLLSFFLFNADLKSALNLSYGLKVSKKLTDEKFLSTDGNSYKISNFKDNYLFIYAGYTRCSTICGKSMQTLKRLSRLTNVNTKYIFLSIDKKNDNLDIIKSYLKPFGNQFYGFTKQDGNLGNLGVELAIQFSEIYFSNEYMNHTDNIYLINKEGILKMIYPSNLRNEVKILEDLNRLENKDG